jgi:hypothetical protein
MGEKAKLAIFRENNVRLPLSKPGLPTLTLMLHPWGADQDHQYIFSAALYRSGQKEPIKLCDNDRPVSLDEARGEVIYALREANREHFEGNPEEDDDVKLVVEFILPRHLLTHPIEGWQRRAAGRGTLDGYCVVVVRDIERQTDESLWMPWREKWRHMMDQDSEGAQLSRWITCTDPPSPPSELIRQLSRSEFCSLGLTFTPERAESSFDLDEALDAGTPVIIWQREPCEDGNGATACATGTCHGMRFKADLSQRLAQRRITDLPELVLDMRRDSPSTPDSLQGFTLLWDHPYRLVKPKDYRLDAPRREEGS